LILVSIYSIGSFISVFLTSGIVKKGARISVVMSVCTGITALALTLMTIFPSFIMMIIAALLVGIFAAGGIWQLGLSLCMQYFPERKGRITGMYSMATSISLMVTPVLTGVMVDHNIKFVFYYGIALTIFGFLVTLFIAKRHKQIIAG
jgi:MFS family permease